MITMLLMLQLFLVDLVDIGFLSASEVGDRRRLDASIEVLADAISSGLEVDAGYESTSFEVAEMRQCTSGATDVDADCSDGTVVASAEEQSWWSENSVTVISVVTVVVVVYVVVILL